MRHPDAQRPTFILVHGAWHGGWCYRKLADLLRRSGYAVFAPTLTGLGERSHLYSDSISLKTHIDDIVNLAHWERLSHIILVGHSYGGMVITGVADVIATRIDALVYLDAFLPHDGQSLHDLIPADVAATQLASSRAGYGIPTIPAAAFGVNTPDRAWVDEMCTAQPPATFTERLKLDKGSIDDRTYVFATRNPLGESFRSTRDALLNDSGWTVRDIEAGHDVMIDAPADVQAILEQVAERSYRRDP
jgi:pimeloyl-ACP methyl ester carboxylesterase